MTANVSTQEPKISWLTKLFRKKVKLTYWLGANQYGQLICDFKEKDPTCIIFKDYYTKNTTVVKFDKEIIYVLEQVN